MGSTISGTRLDIYFQFTGLLTSPLALEEVLVQGQILNAFQNNVPVQNSLKDLFKALFQSGALDDQFNALWQNQGETLATSKINAAVLEAEPNAYNIQPNYPKTGALSASIELQVNAPGITQQWPSGTQGSQLDLTFSLKGVSATFNTTTGFGTFGAPEWKTTFDADLDVLIGVPTDPTIPLVGFLILTTYNTQSGPANFGGLLGGFTTVAGQWISNTVQAIGNWFAQQPSDPGQIQPYPGEPDSETYIPLSQLGPLQSLLAALSVV